MKQDNNLKPIDPFVPFEQKKDKEYGLNIARFIASQWFGGGVIGSGSCAFNTRRDYIINKRKFVRGEKDVNQFKNLIASNKNSLKYLNIDFRYINIARKFCNIVINGMSPENYSLDIRSTDKITVKMNEEKMDNYRKCMVSKLMLNNTLKELGINLMPNSFVPEDEEELELFIAIKDRPKIEIAEELLIDWILKTNDWLELDAQLRADLVNCGIMVTRVYTDKSDGVKVAYVDPENYVHSFVKKNNFDDKFYEGVVDTITVSDLIRESGLGLEQARKIALGYGYTWSQGLTPAENYDKLQGHKVDVLRFAWKTVKTIKYKQKKRQGEVVKLSKRNDDFIAPDHIDTGVLEKTFDTWFEGNYVIGSDYLYEWKECENLYDDVMNKAMSPFLTHALDIRNNVLYAFTDEIEVIADGMQLTALKIKQLLNELRSDVIEIDLDALANLPSEGGTKRAAWQEAFDLFETKSIVLRKRIDAGEYGIKDTGAVNVKPAGQGNQITTLLNSWANDYNLIRENTGINPAVDGSIDANALVGVSEMNRLAGNRATKDIVDTWVRFRLKLSELISTRIQSIYNYSEASSIRKLYDNVISKHFNDHLSVLKNRHLHEFGFTFNIVPAMEAMQEFREDMNIALKEGSISVEEKSEAMNIFKTNPKLAKQYLAYRRRKNMQMRAEENERMLQVKSQNDAMAAQAKVQADTEAYQFKKQIDLQFASEMAQIDLMKQQALNQINKPKEDEKFQQEVYLAQIAAKGKESLEAYKESKKDERTRIQATQQSEIANQRKNNLAPIDFETNGWLEE
ncbi:hypothetical protein [Myroides odoratus]|uniref:Portal protein n=1 Tax=Myroides odoratus TaxID=256 RepID=A0A9Q6ZF22_MYROD|nr:hypothetical protein [Myroides odoratus]EHQ41544.1 hypothetical protein Myrod_0708 [Myroides odoratus DSM 2801]EKB02759.1 hypothetical protein HMPREF9716_03692 [Myroides odoratus CIP 103059]QQT98963.1 hypothetical protein I6I88_12150 [Myroides odoratus]WQD58849.1 hypothetical protein U0010_06825 [Myroides odoratus]STZ28807.1 Uncharacterised protein [Myroides odoratus]